MIRLGGQGDGSLAGGLLTFSEVFADGVQVVVELLGVGIPRPGLSRSEFRVYAGQTVRPAFKSRGYGEGAGCAGRLSNPPEGGTPNGPHPARL